MKTGGKFFYEKFEINMKPINPIFDFFGSIPIIETEIEYEDIIVNCLEAIKKASNLMEDSA